jgi:hypothetical protein
VCWALLRGIGMLDLEVQKLIEDGKVRCWIDIDINESRAAYQRAVDFVGAKNLACASRHPRYVSTQPCHLTPPFVIECR